MFNNENEYKNLKKPTSSHELLTINSIDHCIDNNIEIKKIDNTPLQLKK